MRRSELRGGANEYKINEVLGPNFVQFVGMLKGSKLSDFTFDKFSGANYAPSTGAGAAKPNDVHYDFSEYLMAAAAAFRQIENPDITKNEMAGKYADEIYRIYDELANEKLTSGLINPVNSKFGFTQLPYHESAKLKYLAPGFHYFPYHEDIYPNYNDSRTNGLVNAVRYLYHFIALLDLDNVDVREIMVLLRADNIGFMPYVNDLTKALTESIYYSKGSGLPTDANAQTIIKNGVINGLTAIAVQIINDYKNLPVTTEVVPVQYDDIKTLDYSGSTNFSDYLVKMGVDNTAANTKANKIVIALGKLNSKDFYPDTANANAVVSDKATREKYSLNALLNPIYLDQTLVAKSVNPNTVDEPQLQLGGAKNKKRNNRNNRKDNYDDWNDSSMEHMKGGGRYNKIEPRTVAGSEPASFPFLYGPVTVAPNAGANLGKRFLITEGTQGNKSTNAQLADDATIKLISQNDMTQGKSVISELVNIGAGPNDNGIRAILASLLSYMVINNKKLNQLTGQGQAIYDEMTKGLKAYSKIITRVRSIPTDLNKLLAQYKDNFVTEFTRGTYKNLTIGPTGDIGVLFGPVPPQTEQKNNLADPTIWQFYDTIVTGNPGFYGEFFNLIRTKGGAGYAGEVPLLEAKAVPEADRANYRLNVRKNLGITRLRNIQYGGAQSYGDIVLLSYVPDYPSDGSVAGIWLSRTIRVPEAELQAQGLEAARTIVRQVYFTTPAGTNTATVYNRPIDLTDVNRRVSSTGFFMNNYPDYFKKFLRGLAADSGTTSLPPLWKESEITISDHMLKQGNQWVREGDDYVRVDKDGKEIPGTAIEDNCKFINASTRDCLDFLQTCLPAKDKASYDAFCGKLLDFDFNFTINPGMTTLREEVQKINPAVAFAILKQLKFGSYLYDEPVHPVKGFRRYKVQSVGSWLEELTTGQPTDRCANRNPNPSVPDFDCGPLKDQLGALADEIIKMARDPSKFNFFNYLDILVQWVNANPQVLNPEELINPEYTKGNYPCINKSYRTYTYVNPYKPAEIRLRGVSCGLERLKSNIMNELSGSNASATISTIASIPLGIEMPLSRQGFASPLPFGGLVSQFGGGLYDTELELQNMNQQFGYNLFADIYQDLVYTMDNLVGKKRMKLTENTRNNISEKLEKFRKIEEEIRKSLVNLIERNKLYQASRGHVNSYIDDNAKYAAILSKHSNLLNLSGAYNRKAVNLIDLFQTISKALLGKIEDTGTTSATNTSTYARPMTMGYHYGTKKT